VPGERRREAAPAGWDDGTTAARPMPDWLPPEFRPYLRRVAMLILLAAVLGVVLALVVPGGHHH
jgi:hypothetical protein